MNETEKTLVLLAAILFIALLVSLFGFGMREEAFKSQAIERGYALYCPTNGVWAWEGECQ